VKNYDPYDCGGVFQRKGKAPGEERGMNTNVVATIVGGSAEVCGPRLKRGEN